MMRIFLFLVFGTSMLWHSQSVAEKWSQNTQLLPPYCKDRLKGIKSPEYTKWRKTLGSAFAHIHHYCGGIYAEKMARGTIDQQERKNWLRNVKSEMAYVSRSCSAKCTLYPELHTRWGWALAADGQPSEAVGHFLLAIRAKPEYVPAYAKLSDLYLETNQLDEARKALNEGLEAKPGSSMLERRLKKLTAQ